MSQPAAAMTLAATDALEICCPCSHIGFSLLLHHQGPGVGRLSGPTETLHKNEHFPGCTNGASPAPSLK